MGSIETLDAFKTALGDRWVDEFKAIPKVAWERLPEQARADLRAAWKDLADLEVDALGGRDVSRELVHVKAQIANLTERAGREATAVFIEQIKVVAKHLGAILFAAAEGAVPGLGVVKGLADLGGKP